MGNCAPLDPEYMAHRDVESIIGQAKQAHSETLKILLLGTENSGKSTLLKQMQILYDKGFPNDQRQRFLEVIRSNVLVQFSKLTDIVLEMKQDDASKFLLSSEEMRWIHQFKDLAREQNEYWSTPTAPVFREAAMIIDQLWNKSRLDLALKNRLEHFQPHISFFKKVLELADPNYVPSDEDILRARTPHLGIVERQFCLHTDDVKFTVVDAGGQRSERRKWIQAFENVNCVVFVADTHEFDFKVREVPELYSLTECLNLFEKVVTQDFKSVKSCFLFLNKYDLFLEKIQVDGGASYKQIYPDYTGELDARAILDDITARFLFCLSPADQDRCEVHTTTALDTKSIGKLWGDIVAAETRKSTAQLMDLI